MNRTPHFFVTALGLVCLLGLFIIGSCGKKAPPLPPLENTKFLAPPIKLTSGLRGDLIILKWKHKVHQDTASLEPEGFEVSMASRDPEGCEGCPFAFKTVGIVPLPGMQFEQKIKKGIKYYFRVRAIGENNVRSDYTESILVIRE